MISDITENIYLGGAVDIVHISALVDLDITGYLNVAFDLDLQPPCRFFKNPRVIEYEKVGLIDGPGNQPSRMEGARLVLESLLKSHPKVIVYCWGGISRSTAVIAYFLMVIHQIPWQEALLLVSQKRDIVKVNPGLVELVKCCNVIFNHKRNDCEK